MRIVASLNPYLRKWLLVSLWRFIWRGDIPDDSQNGPELEFSRNFLKNVLIIFSCKLFPKTCKISKTLLTSLAWLTFQFETKACELIIVPLKMHLVSFEEGLKFTSKKVLTEFTQRRFPVIQGWALLLIYTGLNIYQCSWYIQHRNSCADLLTKWSSLLIICFWH